MTSMRRFVGSASFALLTCLLMAGATVVAFVVLKLDGGEEDSGLNFRCLWRLDADQKKFMIPEAPIATNSIYLLWITIQRNTLRRCKCRPVPAIAFEQFRQLG